MHQSQPRSRIRRTLAVCLAALMTAATLTSPAQAFPAASRQDVLNYLASITGRNIVSGQHNKEPASLPGQYTQQVYNVTGQWPGLWGGDLMFRAVDAANRQRVVDQAKQEWANGSLVALTWHMCTPTGPSTCEFEGGVKTNISATQFSQIIQDGTALNTTWKRRLDEVVPYLQQLKDAGVPVLFRPLHEMNESWNWWGNRPGPSGGARLYQITRDYLVGKGLSNLIWVWNVQDNPAGGWASYYPGSSYVDVVSLDVWYKGYPSASDYQQIQNIAAGKPIAIAEMGKVPNASLLDSQTRWTYFMVWSEQLVGNNTNAEIQAGYFHPRTLNQGEVNLTTGSQPARTGPITGVGGKCVDVAGAGTANGTAVGLYDCNGTAAQRWTIGTDGTIRALGKCMDVVGQGTANGTQIQIWDCNGSGAQQWQSVGNGQLRNPQSGRVLDVPGGSTANGTRLQIWDANSNAWQRWTLPA
ncbi:glycosyl hydrolase [Acrocarpospora catenulata]|uniref:glycosyl hydrolase n=1 Tax=Acrocarpospora catenulata TaxID=2836182 RepID=UPI0020239364|nr:glycosyl hydrolase [Acrocarpospora catenulata]